MTLVTQIGFQNSQKESQSVSAFLNNEKIGWVKNRAGEYNGNFVTATSKRASTIWFLAKSEVSSGDVVRLEISVFIRGMGYDEDRSRVVEWIIDENIDPSEYSMRKVGDPHFPLLYGKVSLIQSRSKIDDRRDSAASLIENSVDEG